MSPEITRRTIIRGALAAAVAGSALRAWAQTELALGAATLTTLSDGHLLLPPDFVFAPMSPPDVERIVAEFGLSLEGEVASPCNLTLYRSGADTVLFDAGSGPGFMPTAGRIVEALDAAGLAPEDITHVAFTHGHPDHLWGVLDDFDEPLFPEARHLFGAVERDYWMDPGTVTAIGEARAMFAAGARRRLETMADRIEVFADGDEIVPGVTARLTPGHTPGHMSFLIDTGDAQALVLGDAIGNPHVSFAAPDLPVGPDQDQETAARTRVALLEMLAAEAMPLVGFHLPEGGIGRAERAGAGYRFVPL